MNRHLQIAVAVLWGVFAGALVAIKTRVDPPAPPTAKDIAREVAATLDPLLAVETAKQQDALVEVRQRQHRLVTDIMTRPVAAGATTEERIRLPKGAKVKSLFLTGQGRAFATKVKKDTEAGSEAMHIILTATNATDIPRRFSGLLEYEVTP